jgi:hypothetical protein
MMLADRLWFVKVNSHKRRYGTVPATDFAEETP